MTTKISTKDISDLRGRTGAGIGDCKAALEEAAGDQSKAADILQKKGIARADKRAGRSASQGLIVIEVATDGKSAAMIELDCETDFVARTEVFITLAKDLARHAAAHAPVGIAAEGWDGGSFRGKTVAEIVKEL